MPFVSNEQVDSFMFDTMQYRKSVCRKRIARFHTQMKRKYCIAQVQVKKLNVQNAWKYTNVKLEKFNDQRDLFNSSLFNTRLSRI